MAEEAVEEAADEFDAAWPPTGVFQCSDCRCWITVFPNGGEKRSRYYARMHCAAVHVEQPFFRCQQQRCRRAYRTRKSVVSHMRRRHRQLFGGFDVLVAPADQLALVDPIVARCFPDVHFPPPMRNRIPN